MDDKLLAIQHFRKAIPIEQLGDFNFYMDKVGALVTDDPVWLHCVNYCDIHQIDFVPATFTILVDCFGNGVRPEYARDELRDYIVNLIRLHQVDIKDYH